MLFSIRSFFVALAVVTVVGFMLSPPQGAAQDQDGLPPLAGERDIGPEIPDKGIGNNAVTKAARLRDAVARIDPGAEFSERGAIFTVSGVQVTLVYDIAADRMRLVSPVATVNDIDADDLIRLMQANFDSALDARYALAQGAVWSTFIHPLSSLTLDDFASGIGQTVNLVTTFGSSYSSGALIFGGGDSAQQQRDLIEDLKDKSREI